MGLTAKKVYAILNGKIQKVSGDVSSLGTAILYKGSVASESALPANPSIGDMYNIESTSSYGEAGMNVAWTGTEWDTMGAMIDVSALQDQITQNKNAISELSEKVNLIVDGNEVEY